MTCSIGMSGGACAAMMCSSIVFMLGAFLHHQALVLGVHVVDLDVADDQCVLARRVVADGVKDVAQRLQRDAHVAVRAQHCVRLA